MGYTHRELSKIAGVGRRTLDRIAAGTCTPSHGVLLSLMAPLGYPRAVADLLHRRAFASPDEERPGLTGQDLLQLLLTMTPEERARPVKGAVTGAVVVGLKVAAGALLIEARVG